MPTSRTLRRLRHLGVLATAAVLPAGLCHCIDTGSKRTTDAGVVPVPSRDAGEPPPAPRDGAAPPSRDAEPSVDAAPDADAQVDAGPSGVLDVTFAGTGFVLRSGVAQHDAGAVQDLAYAGALDSTGRVIIAGQSFDGANTNMAVTRLLGDGSVDTTFGNGGAFWKKGTLSPNYDSAYGVAIGAGDKVIATGQSGNGTIYEATWKLLVGGTLDTTFAGTGYAGHTSTTGGPQTYDQAQAVAEDGAGAVFATGYSEHSNAAIDMVVWKYTSLGVPDTTFGASNGSISAVQTAGAPANDYWDSGEALVIDANGRPVVCGSSYKDGNQHAAAVVWRRMTGGAADTTFNTTGHVVLTNVAKNVTTEQDTASAVALDASGNLIVGGASFTTGAGPIYRGWLVRLSATGGLDATFGTNGVVTLEPPGTDVWSGVASVAVDSKGRIVVAGYARPGFTQASMVVWRLDATGALDTTFGTGGVFTAKGTAGGVSDSAVSVSIGAGDRIVVTGNSNGKMAAWRLTP